LELNKILVVHVTEHLHQIIEFTDGGDPTGFQEQIAEGCYTHNQFMTALEAGEFKNLNKEGRVRLLFS
jgi:hypothetical protein